MDSCTRRFAVETIAPECERNNNSISDLLSRLGIAGRRSLVDHFLILIISSLGEQTRTWFMRQDRRIQMFRTFFISRMSRFTHHRFELSSSDLHSSPPTKT